MWYVLQCYQHDILALSDVMQRPHKPRSCTTTDSEPNRERLNTARAEYIIMFSLCSCRSLLCSLYALLLKGLTAAGNVDEIEPPPMDEETAYKPKKRPTGTRSGKTAHGTKPGQLYYYHSAGILCGLCSCVIGFCGCYFLS